MKKTLFMTLMITTLLALLSSCGGNTTTAPSTTIPMTTAPLSPTATAPITTLPTITIVPTPTVAAPGDDYIFVSAMAGLYYNLNIVHNYYSDGLTAMSSFQVGDGTITSSIRYNGVMLADYNPADFGDEKNKIPTEMSDKLPPDGAMAAPPGACPAAAEPYEKFMTKDGEVVTPDLFKEKDVVTLPVSMINASQNDPGSLFSIMKKLVPQNDMRLGDASGWNTLLWDKLKALQVPATTLMDYQMWTLSGDLESQLVAKFRQSLIDAGVPQRVIDAFDQSKNSGWYAKTRPSSGDALAKMDIQAKLTGTVNGTVHEWRDITFPALGQDPVFGVQHGDGTVNFDLPKIGQVKCSVDIMFDQFDDLGRAINGTVTATAVDYQGFQIVFTYTPDGGKNGVVYQDGKEIGYLTMTTDAEKFTNYITVKEGTELKLPDPAQPVQTIIQ